MAKLCPITNSYVLYLDCLECDEKDCEKIGENNEYSKSDPSVPELRRGEDRCEDSGRADI